jgi:DNA mismatch repair ATPase MutS
MFHLAANDILVRSLESIRTVKSLVRERKEASEVKPVLEEVLNEAHELRRYYNRELEKTFKWTPPTSHYKMFFLNKFFGNDYSPDTATVDD